MDGVVCYSLHGRQPHALARHAQARTLQPAADLAGHIAAGDARVAHRKRVVVMSELSV